MSPSRFTWFRAPPSDRLRIGECIVDVPLREIIRADGSTTRVTLKVIAVLLVLAEHAGRVVTRDMLLASVWAGTMPTLDVVTQAVASLRKALGGEGENSTCVETIPKTGYRLLATVQWLPSTPAPAQEATAPRPAADAHPRWRALAMIAAGLALLATLSWSMAGWWDAPPHPASGQGPAVVAMTGDIAYTLLTSRPGRETEPALSPDGGSVAYAMPPGAPDGPSAIFVQSAQPTPPRQLTKPPPGHSDQLPRWSPDGRQLMFVRLDDQGCELRLLPATGGVERVVGRCDRLSGGRYDWLPDGSGVVAGLRPDQSGTPAPLSILRLDSGQWQSMTYPIEPGNVDFDPRFSSDGSRLAFRRNLSRSDIWVMPAQGGEPKRITYLSGNITGWDWSPDERSLLVGLRRGALQLVRHDIASGRSIALGRVPTTNLDVSARGGNMVFAIDAARIAMFRYPLPLREAASPEPLFPSTGTDLLSSPSPDGRMIAFHSDRSRETRLWIGEPGNPERLRMIDGFVPISRHPPQWSLDGTRLLVIGEPSDANGNPGPRLYEVDVASGRVGTIALAGSPYFAQYLPERRLLAITDLGTGKWSLRILDLAAQGRVVAELRDIGEARFDPASAQVYFVRIDSPGLWRVGLDLDAPSLLDTREPAVYWMRYWALRDGKAFTLGAPVSGCAAPWHWMGATSGTRSRAGCLDREHRGAPELGLVPSRGGEWLYASMMAGEANSDIGMLDLTALGGRGSSTP